MKGPGEGFNQKFSVGAMTRITHIQKNELNSPIPFNRLPCFALFMTIISVNPTGPLLEQRGEEAASPEGQRIQTKTRVHDAESRGLPEGWQVKTHSTWRASPPNLSFQDLILLIFLSRDAVSSADDTVELPVPVHNDNMVPLSQKKMSRKRNRRILNNWNTIQELLAHGSRSHDGMKIFNPLLSFTTVWRADDSAENRELSTLVNKNFYCSDRCLYVSHKDSKKNVFTFFATH